MKVKGVIFDLDGTIYLGDRLIPGADKVVQTLREQDKQVVFLSNKPIEPRSAYAEKLTRLGIPTPTDDVINSSQVAADFFAREMAGARVFCIGEPPLLKELDDAGLEQAQRPEHTDLVLISLDRDLSYDKIHFAYHAAKAGAKVWATNPDLVCPMPDDEIIDAGATIAALEALLRRPIDGLIGKPSQMMVRTILEHMGLPSQACLMVGDRLETDIAMGKEAGMTAALVLTGVTKRYMLEGNPVQPDYVLESVQGVLGL
ncbi:MAG: HAD-IIA family hydrolase [bacterium]|nr:HAD-IIA family hydrolase [bacterium]